MWLMSERQLFPNNPVYRFRVDDLTMSLVFSICGPVGLILVVTYWLVTLLERFEDAHAPRTLFTIKKRPR